MFTLTLTLTLVLFQQPHCVAWSSGSKLIASCSGCSVLVWYSDSDSDAAETRRRVVVALRGHTKIVSCVVFGAEIQTQTQTAFLLVSAGGDRKIIVWRFCEGGDIKAPHTLHTDAASKISMSLFDHGLVSSSREGKVQVWCIYLCVCRYVGMKVCRYVCMCMCMCV